MWAEHIEDPALQRLIDLAAAIDDVQARGNRLEKTIRPPLVALSASPRSATPLSKMPLEEMLRIIRGLHYGLDHDTISAWTTIPTPVVVEVEKVWSFLRAQPEVAPLERAYSTARHHMDEVATLLEEALRG